MMKLALVLLLTVMPLVATAQVEVEAADILVDTDWRAAYDEYAPVYGLMAAFSSAVEEGLQVTVYFADWCDDSRLEVPRFIKLANELANPALEVHYFGSIDRKTEGHKYFVDADKVEKVPTFIVSRNGHELGRIVEHPREGFLEDLLEIVY